MSIITEKTYSEQSTAKTVSNFFKQYRLGSALKQAGAYKQKGVPVAAVFMYLLSLVYTGKSMFQDMRSAVPFAQGLTKDTVYRFLNWMHINWQMLLFSIALRVVADIDKLTSDDRTSAFIIDDTIYEALYAKKRELVSLVHDHAAKGKNKYKWGYRMLSLCWSDGASLIPLTFRHLASADEKNQRCGIKPGLDKRTRAYRIRKEAVSKATEVLLIMLRAALNAGITAKHVLFDTWFAYPVTIIKIVGLGLNVTARVKDTTKIKYLVNGERKTASEIFKNNRKRTGRSRYLLSVPVHLSAIENGETAIIPARLVYVRNRQKRNNWIAIVTTDLTLTEEEVIALYGKRWAIEVFFKICKSYLKLAKEFQQLSYDAITAHTAIVMIRYMILSLEKRKQEDPRSLGELFFQSFDEVADIRFEQAMLLIMSLLEDILENEDLGLTDEQINKIMDSFIEKLPHYFRLCLQPGLAA